MSIAASEIKFMKSQNISDSSSNGGGLTANLIADSVAGNVFPNTTEEERIAGIPERFRKVFIKVHSDNQDTLFASTVFQDNPTPGDDNISFFDGWLADTQNDITGTERRYGSGTFASTALSGATEIEVLVEDGNTGVFEDGDRIRITNKVNLTDVGGNEQFVYIVGAPSVSLNVLTITIDTPLEADYVGGTSRASTVMDLGDIVAGVDAVTVTAAGDGDYDYDSFPIGVNNKGTVDDTFTLTFTSATAFDIEGAAVGSVGSGNTTSGASPVNTVTGSPYFEITAGGFSGTFEAGDTIEITTYSASYPLWLRQVVPAGSSAISSNVTRFVVDGQTV